MSDDPNLKPITFHEFMEKAADHFAEQAGPGDVHAGWERLRATLDADEETES